PVKVVGNRSTADTTASLSHEKNETLLTTTNEKNNNTSSIATNSWKDAATGRLQKQDDTSEEEAAERRELNQALSRLAELFPDIKVEVFRELLTRFDGTSRLQVCTEQLLRYRTEWVKGRWNIPGSSSKTADEHVHATLATYPSKNNSGQPNTEKLFDHSSPWNSKPSLDLPSTPSSPRTISHTHELARHYANYPARHGLLHSRTFSLYAARSRGVAISTAKIILQYHGAGSRANTAV
ncbi:hypothetical protein KEM54_004527, partial [Ascosphaera aggregata]